MLKKQSMAKAIKDPHRQWQKSTLAIKSKTFYNAASQ
jgi:hypothetical protein